MSRAKTIKINFRIMKEEEVLYEQAAGQRNVSLSDWMRETLKKTAMQEVYGDEDNNPHEKDDKTVSADIEATLRSAMMAMFIVNDKLKVSEDEQRMYAGLVKDQIKQIKKQMAKTSEKPR